ncbi:MAG: histidine kinase, partial [Actinomyces bouchesdurhonensis]|nr:histidine kinase [Actinomyces bouchesdurhonensis]
ESDAGWILVAASRFFVGEGLSDRQIHVMARRGLIIGLQAAQELPTLFDTPEESAE